MQGFSQGGVREGWDERDMVQLRARHQGWVLALPVTPVLTSRDKMSDKP